MQPSFFDYAMEYQGGKKSTKFLSEMKELIPFKAIEKLLIEKSIYKPNRGKQGRPSTPANILIGALFLQSWYGLSDPMTDGKVDGFGQDGLLINYIRNDSVKDYFGLKNDNGVLITKVEYGIKDFKENDILLEIDGKTIANDGTIES